MIRREVRGIKWARDLYEIAAAVPAVAALIELAGIKAGWVVVRLGRRRWVLRRRDVVGLLDREEIIWASRWRDATLFKALQLSVDAASTLTPSAKVLPRPDAGKHAFGYPPARRYLHVDSRGAAVAVAEVPSATLVRMGLLPRPIEKGRGPLKERSSKLKHSARAKPPVRAGGTRGSVEAGKEVGEIAEPLDVPGHGSSTSDTVSIVRAVSDLIAPSPVSPPTRPVARGRGGPAGGPENAPPLPATTPAGGVTRRSRGVPPASVAGPAAAPPPAKAVVEDDEGTNPVRYPSLESDRPPSRGQPITIIVDLLRERSAHTAGSALDMGELAVDWESLAVDVQLMASGIDFGAGGSRGQVTIRRNSDSVAARVSGTVTTDGPVEVTASFLCGNRFAGMANRKLQAGAAAAPADSGLVSIDVRAEEPDVTVEIYVPDASAPGKLHWFVNPRERFDGLPARLNDQVDLGVSPASFAAGLFGRFATLERGQHESRIRSHGSELWNKAPACWKDTYWALCAHYHRPLTIQFITDEPSVAWELMRPSRESAAAPEVHEPLGIGHSVARWVAALKGKMRNRLSTGRLYTIVPKYKSAGRRLSRAEAEGQVLQRDFGAIAVAGTCASVLGLLQQAEVSEPMAMLHFAGHGKFDAGAVTESAILLEDGEVTVSELGSPEVQLGVKFRPLVFFNACEVGATGQVLGAVGGWGRACIERSFGGFIAPLWAVDDEDAGTVASELLTGILVDHNQPVSTVLREIRRKHGSVSPTFYSYVFFGDVTARIAA